MSLSFQSAVEHYTHLKEEWSSWIINFTEHIDKLRSPTPTASPISIDNQKTTGILQNPFPARFLKTLTGSIIPTTSLFLRECKSLYGSSGSSINARKPSTDSSASLSSLSPHLRGDSWAKSCVNGMIGLVDSIHSIQQRRQFHFDTANAKTETALNLWAPGEVEIWFMVCQLMLDLEAWIELLDAGADESIRQESNTRLTTVPVITRRIVDSSQLESPRHNNRMFRVFAKEDGDDSDGDNADKLHEQEQHPKASLKINTATVPEQHPNKQVAPRSPNSVAPTKCIPTTARPRITSKINAQIDQIIARDTMYGGHRSPPAPPTAPRRNSSKDVLHEMKIVTMPENIKDMHISDESSKRTSLIPEQTRKRWIISFIGEDEVNMGAIMEEVKLYMNFSYRRESSIKTAVPVKSVAIQARPALPGHRQKQKIKHLSYVKDKPLPTPPINDENVLDDDAVDIGNTSLKKRWYATLPHKKSKSLKLKFPILRA